MACWFCRFWVEGQGTCAPCCYLSGLRLRRAACTRLPLERVENRMDDAFHTLRLEGTLALHEPVGAAVQPDQLAVARFETLLDERRQPGEDDELLRIADRRLDDVASEEILEAVMAAEVGLQAHLLRCEGDIVAVEKRHEECIDRRSDELLRRRCRLFARTTAYLSFLVPDRFAQGNCPLAKPFVAGRRLFELPLEFLQCVEKLGSRHRCDAGRRAAGVADGATRASQVDQRFEERDFVLEAQLLELAGISVVADVHLGDETAARRSHRFGVEREPSAAGIFPDEVDAGLVCRRVVGTHRQCPACSDEDLDVVPKALQPLRRRSSLAAVIATEDRNVPAEEFFLKSMSFGFTICHGGTLSCLKCPVL